MMKSWLVAGAVSAALMGPMTAWADLTLGIFPRRPANQTVPAFTPLAEKLSAELGEKVTLVVAKDFDTFWQNVTDKKYDIVHFNQYQYLKSKNLGYKAIVANEEQKQKDLAGVLVVRKDSGITKVADLKGKTIMFGGDEKAMAAYIAPTAILKKHGLTEGKDYQAKFAPNPPAAAMAVFNKAADAGGAGDVVLEQKAVTSAINVADMLVLEKSDTFAQLPWAVKGDLADAKSAKIQQVMIGLESSPEGKAILKAAMVNSFFKVSDADYNKAKQLIESVTGEKL